MSVREKGSASAARGTGASGGDAADLPYHVELWRQGGVERVLGRAASAALARAIFKAAMGEHPERRVTLRRGGKVIADSAA